MTETTVHASCILLDETGILIRGAAGSGKSTLVRRLIENAQARGRFGRLVSDDRVVLARKGQRIVARAVDAVAGMLEIRGLGLVRLPWEAAAVVRLVVDCGALAPRLPSDDLLQADLLGLSLPRVEVAAGSDPVGLVLWRLRAVQDTVAAES